MLKLLALSVGLILVAFSLAAQVPASTAPDPAPDKANPAALVTFQIPSHGERLNALAYVASGAGPHPVAILLHGFPGNERNLDIAQAIRHAGWDALFFDYRGSWGTSGTFSFEHSFEDTLAAIAWLREPANAARLHADPARIVLLGHSMGGLMALHGGAHDPRVEAVGVFSAANMAGRWLPMVKAGKQDAAVTQYIPRLTELGTYPLAGCTAESLARELIFHAAEWNFVDFAPQLASRPLLVITSDDGLAEDSNQLSTRVRAVKGSSVTTLHLATDHSYSGERAALTNAILNWLDTLAFDATLRQSHRALEAILNGNPKLYEDLFADRDDITLGNPFGPFGTGRAQVVATLANAASKYHAGQVLGVDLVARYGDDHFITVVEIEHDRAKVGASDQFAEFNVRVTSLYERIHGDWKLIHRHADPITTARAAESVLAK